MKQTTTRQLVETSLFAALIFLSIQFFRIPVGAQFIHFGNALVVVGVLLFGAKRGAVAASIGIAIFDILNGYASEVWLIVLESIIVCYVLYLVYEKGLKAKDSLQNIVIAGIVAALVKIVLNLLKYTLTSVIVGNLPLATAFLTAIAKITGTFGSSLATVIAVPILYPILKRLIKKD